MLAIARAEPVLLRISRPLRFFRVALHPLIIATNAPANWVVARRLPRRPRRRSTRRPRRRSCNC